MPKKPRTYYVYILTSNSGTLYTGVTNSIFHRTLQHKSKETPGFTSKYDVTRLVYYEMFNDVLPRSVGKRRSKGGRARKKSH